MRHLIFLFVFLMGTLSFSYAQKPVTENQVPAIVVNDLKTRITEGQTVKWFQMDSTTYEARYVTTGGTKTAVRFYKTTTETRWDVDLKWMPETIKKYIDSTYKGAKVESLCIADTKGKKIYEAVIKQKKQRILLSFEINGVFIEATPIVENKKK